MSFDDLISNFGGILGLYVGISFAALLHIPVFLTRKATERFSPQAQNSKVRTTQFEEMRRITTHRCAVGSSREYANTSDSAHFRLEMLERRLELLAQDLAQTKLSLHVQSG